MPDMSHDDARRNPAWQALVLGLFYLACFLAAGLGALFTMVSLGTWYAGLAKPSWNPPNWIFGPVWTVLYAMMAVAGWLVWRAGGPAGRQALRWFAVQLVLNVGWSAVFFGLQMPGVAAVEILALWVAIAGTLATSWRVSRPAGVLLIPYLLWVSFAVALNAAIWRLNS
jgi:tryptophan-rich sensory protein